MTSSLVIFQYFSMTSFVRGFFSFDHNIVS